MEKCIEKFYITDGVLYEADTFEKNNKFDGVTLYEVIRVIDGVPLFLEEHLERMENTCRLTGIKMKFKKEDIKKHLIKLIASNSVSDGNVKMIFNKDIEEKLSLYFIPHSYPSKEMYEKGVETILYFGERNNPNAKVINNDFRNKVNLEIEKAKVFEAILVDDNGNITEGSRSNIFMIKGHILYTATMKAVLPGVTRDRVIKLVNKIGIEFIEKDISNKEIFEMDAVFITGTSPKILPICKIDGKYINSTENIMLKNILKNYDELIKNYIKTNK